MNFKILVLFALFVGPIVRITWAASKDQVDSKKNFSRLWTSSGRQARSRYSSILHFDNCF